MFLDKRSSSKVSYSFLSIESRWFRDCVLEGHFKNVSVAFNPKKYFIFDYKIINKDCHKKINHLKKEL